MRRTMAYLPERDALNGKDGRAIYTTNGQQVELFVVKNLQIDYSIEESDSKDDWTKLAQKKTTGISPTGSVTLYYTIS